MEVALYQAIITILTVTVLGLAYRYAKLKDTIKKRKPTIDLTEFIGDLANGGGVVSIRVDPEHLLLRSPRG